MTTLLYLFAAVGFLVTLCFVCFVAVLVAVVWADAKRPKPPVLYQTRPPYLRVVR